MRGFLVLMVAGFVLLGGCIEHKSEDPIECYRLWSGEEPPSDVKVLNAKYWQSPHWTKEYILYMELTAPSKWRKEFIKENHLTLDSNEWMPPSDIPHWFLPTTNYLQWKLYQSDESSIFEDTVTGKMFLYEIQL
jgi:hypothetical protein